MEKKFIEFVEWKTIAIASSGIVIMRANILIEIMSDAHTFCIFIDKHIFDTWFFEAQTMSVMRTNTKTQMRRGFDSSRILNASNLMTCSASNRLKLTENMQCTVVSHLSVTNLDKHTSDERSKYFIFFVKTCAFVEDACFIVIKFIYLSSQSILFFLF